ncbi:hypothetical protein [Streptomyces subrutilus]|uniref:hypothetical protein n=1 Tax=Streptomyces subrutilus TaxID=36818 RepID=UPI0033C82677
MRKALARSTTALLGVLLLASCTSGGSEARSANPCGIGTASQEEALVREVLGSQDFTTKDYGSTSGFVDEAKRALPVLRPEKHTFYTNVCGYGTADERGAGGMTFLAGWLLRTSGAPSSPGDVPYALNGVRGVASDSRSTLLVPCDMPGDLREQSQKVWLTGDLTFGQSRPATDQAAKDRRMTLAYLMTRRVADALGCENKPLEKAPVVKPAPTP